MSDDMKHNLLLGIVATLFILYTTGFTQPSTIAAPTVIVGAG